MKAIIIAAGRGKRMKELTRDIPKCLLEFNGKRLLDIQLEALRQNGIEDISVVVGYKREKVQYPGLKYYINDRFEHNNILHSLFFAEEEMNSDFIATYSDIIYDKYIVEKLMEDDNDISIVVDTAWRALYEDRADHPIEEAENVIFDPVDKNVLKIGKIIQDKHLANGEFLGMMKCSKAGALTFRRHFNNLKLTHSGRPFQKAPTFEDAYITDMMQDLVDSGISVNCVTIAGGWKEIDTVEDYKKTLKAFLP